MPEAARPVVVLAFDFGLKHIGVACGQSITGSANPVATLPARNGRPQRSRVEAEITQWGPSQLVVGLPLNMDDSESEITVAARGFAHWLAELSGLPVALVDERLTSREANEGYAADPRNNHALAAVVIAQSYLRDPGSTLERL